MRFRRRAARVLAAACVALAAVSSPARAHGVTVELYHPMAADSALQTAFLVPWAEKIAKESGGRLHVRLHPDTDAGKSGSGLYDRVRDEDIDAAWTPVPTVGDRFRDLRPFELPAQVHRVEGGSRALMEYVRANDLLDRDFDEVKLLAAHLDDGSVLHWRAPPAGGSWDVRDRRVGVANDVDEAVVRSLGGLPMRADAGAIGIAIANGDLDAALMSWSRATAAGVAKATSAHADFGPDGVGLARSTYALVMSKGSFRGLPDDLKAVLVANSGPDTAAWLGRIMEEAARAARDAAGKAGRIVPPLSPEEREKLAAPSRSALEKTLPAAQIDSAREWLGRHDPTR